MRRRRNLTNIADLVCTEIRSERPKIKSFKFFSINSVLCSFQGELRSFQGELSSNSPHVATALVPMVFVSYDALILKRGLA